MAKKIQIRMAALAAAESLVDFWPPSSGPERCHGLKADLAGTFSIDLKHPYRLLFKPTDPEHSSAAKDEKARWAAIKSIVVTGIEDTHG
jgi:plasmid maintenance system killer protein